MYSDQEDCFRDLRVKCVCDKALLELFLEFHKHMRCENSVEDFPRAQGHYRSEQYVTAAFGGTTSFRGAL